MGKCVRIHRSGSSNHPSPSPASGESAAYLTLRSGRRVPVSAAAACSTLPGSRHRRGSSSACRRRCGAKGASCGSPGRRRKSVELSSAVLAGGGRPEEEETPTSQASPVVGGDGRRDDSSELNTSLAGDVMRTKHEHGSKSCVVTGQRSPAPSPVLEAEMEAFFAAAELAERRRFAAAYNYDVALDRPLEGRFEWAPVST